MVCVIISVALSAFILLYLMLSCGSCVVYNPSWAEEIRQTTNLADLRTFCNSLLWYSENSYKDSGLFTRIVLIASFIQMISGIVLLRYFMRRHSK